MSDQNMAGASEDPDMGNPSQMSEGRGPGGMPSATETDTSDDKSGAESMDDDMSDGDTTSS